MSDQALALLDQWLIIVAQPKIIVPLIGGLAIGYMVCKSPLVSRLKRYSDRCFYTYGANSIGAGGLFIWTQQDQPLEAVLSMLILVMGSAVIIPWAWFNVWGKK